MKKNNKGFTLIELLAVIVVLAIIMVIATTQINGTIRRSRANSFYDSVQMIERNAEMICAQDNEITESELAELSDIEHEGNDITDEDYDISISGESVTVTAKGQFDNVDLRDYYQERNCTTSEENGKTCQGDVTKNSITDVAEHSMTFRVDCSKTTSAAQ